MDFEALSKQFFRIFFPVYCAGCKIEGTLLCDNCKNNIKRAQQSCVGCEQFSAQGFSHEHCIQQNKYLPQQLICCFDYKNEVVKNIIHSLKYELVQDYAEVIAGLCQETFNSLSAIDIIVPVPLHKYKMNSRGFNQSELIAKHLLKDLSKTLLLPTALQKIKNTPPQMQLNRTQRQNNIRNVFVADICVEDKSILLVDDVCTTGSTLLECSKALLAAGAKSVICLVFAKD